MKRLIVILCLFTCIHAPGKAKPGKTAKVKDAALSVDITALMTGRNAKIGVSHLFADRWSAEGSFSMPAPEFRAGAKYWTGKYQDGGYFGFFCSHDLNYGTDMVVACGYAMRICRYAGLSAGYELKIIDSIGNGAFRTEGITIELNIIF